MQKRRRLIYQINQARHAMMKSMDVGCREALGISVTQLSALMVLKEREHCLMKELADALMLDNSAVTGLAKRMQNKDLIVRSACPTDARASRLSLSTKGLSLPGKRITNRRLAICVEPLVGMDLGQCES